MKQEKHLTPAELLDYLFEHGKFDKKFIEQHLQKCNICSDKFGKIQMILKNTFLSKKKKTYKKTKDCLDDNFIAGYIDEKLSPADKTKVEKHLLKCDYCLNRFLEVFYATEKLKSVSLPLLPEKLKKYIISLADTFILKIKRTVKGLKITDTNLSEYKLVPLTSILRAKSGLKKTLKVIKFSIKIFQINTKFLIIPENKNKVNLSIKFEYTKYPDISIKILKNKKVIFQDKAKTKKEFIYTLESGKYNIQFIKSRKKISLLFEIEYS